MAKYSKGAGKKVEKAMHEMHEGKLKSGKSNKKVTSRKQAIAIGLSEAREKGAKVPKSYALLLHASFWPDVVPVFEEIHLVVDATTP